MASPSVLTFEPVYHGALELMMPAINGVALKERISRHERSYDYVPAFGFHECAYERVMLSEEPDLPGHRTSLLVCGECGNLSCGAISAVISREGESVHWKEIGVANDRGGEDEAPLLFTKVKAFSFAWLQYCDAVRMARTSI